MNVKLLIWDWNGTILDDADLCLSIENELLAERGMPTITKTWYLEHFSFPVRAYYARMGYTFETESFESVSEIFMRRYRERYAYCPIRSGIETVLETAAARGIRQTLLSATQQDDLFEQVQRLGVIRYFSELIGQDDILGASKIERAKAYAARIGIDPKEALLIGDTDHDAEAANAIGCPCVLLAGGHQSKNVLQRCGAQTVNDADELFQLLFS